MYVVCECMANSHKYIVSVWVHSPAISLSFHSPVTQEHTTLYIATAVYQGGDQLDHCQVSLAVQREAEVAEKEDRGSCGEVRRRDMHF